MPKSRKRGGAKSHRKRVQARNSNVEANQNRFRNIFQQEMMKELEEQKKMMEETQTEIVEVEDTDSQKEGV